MGENMAKKGVINVITLVLLVVIAVAAVAAVWAWMSGFLPGIFPRTTVAPEPIAVASLACDSSTGISLSVRNTGSRQIPAGDWGVTVTKLDPTTGAWRSLCSHTETGVSALGVGSTTSISIDAATCSFNSGDELTVTVTSPQGAAASQSCIAS